MTSGVAKILIGPHGAPNAHAGMGIVIDDRKILTCAHVVNRALNRPFEAQDQPAGSVKISFPMPGGAPPTRTGVVSTWRPMGNHSESDIAVLELDEKVPSGVGVAQLAKPHQLQTGDDVFVFGIQAGRVDGANTIAKFVGLVEAGLGQLNGGPWTQSFIESGYSGAGVRLAGGALVGMTTVRVGGKDIALMTTSETLCKVLNIHQVSADGLSFSPPERAMIVPIKSDKDGVRGDAITQFCRALGKNVMSQLAVPQLRQSSHAKSPAGIPNERYYYIVDPTNELNLLATDNDNDISDWPISIELFFKGPRLDATVEFEIALVINIDSDMELFGSVLHDQRMLDYRHRIENNPGVRSIVDNLGIGPDGSLEMRIWRRLTLMGLGASRAVKDAADPEGRGSISAVDDIVRLMRECEPIVNATVFSYNRRGTTLP